MALTAAPSMLERLRKTSRAGSGRHRLVDLTLITAGTIALVAFVYYCFRPPSAGEGELGGPAGATILRYIAFAAAPAALFASLRLRPSLRAAVAGLVILAVTALYTTEVV